MTMLLQVNVYEKAELKHSDEFTGPVELGRQDYAERGPFTRRFDADRNRWRLIIAPGAENAIGRHHALLEPLPTGKVRLSNGTREAPIKFLDRPDLPGGMSCEVNLPILMILGTRRVQVQSAAVPDLHTLRRATHPPRAAGPGSSVRFPALSQRGGSPLDYRELVEWVHTVMDVLQAAADSNDFFQVAAQAVVDMVDLDSCKVLRYAENDWKVQAAARAPRLNEGQDRQPSRRVLDQVLKERRTFWEVPETSTRSLLGLEAVVAAPILAHTGEVVGALYGDRVASLVPGAAGPISELEAMLVELLARGVAAGLARMRHEDAAREAQVQFEQFFTKELAAQLARNPNWLEGRDAEVTVLFCDIRGFSRLSERLGAEKTVAWCKAVLDMLSDCVLQQGGVLVDYVGDGLMALWGAPDAQPDHAARACRAALGMLAGLPALKEAWEPILGEKMDLGIGINSGRATVGNVGSQFKFKYGARGTTVNVASRVEGATKHFKSRALITGPTQAALPEEELRTRCLGPIKVVGIEAPVEIHELIPSDHPDWPASKIEFEKALELFIQQDFRMAARCLGNWREHHPDDTVALMLLYRAVRYSVEGAPPEHPVWTLSGK
jgi:adenylate cyclase